MADVRTPLPPLGPSNLRRKTVWLDLERSRLRTIFHVYGLSSKRDLSSPQECVHIRRRLNCNLLLRNVTGIGVHD